LNEPPDKTIHDVHTLTVAVLTQQSVGIPAGNVHLADESNFNVASRFRHHWDQFHLAKQGRQQRHVRTNCKERTSPALQVALYLEVELLVQTMHYQCDFLAVMGGARMLTRISSTFKEMV
jgi:broad specificity polyphosphatase/5'/3'-nucleotidase SurE